MISRVTHRPNTALIILCHDISLEQHYKLAVPSRALVMSGSGLASALSTGQYYNKGLEVDCVMDMGALDELPHETKLARMQSAPRKGHRRSTRTEEVAAVRPVEHDHASSLYKARYRDDMILERTNLPLKLWKPVEGRGGGGGQLGPWQKQRRRVCFVAVCG